MKYLIHIKIELQKIVMDPALYAKFISNPELGKAIMSKQASEYMSVMQLELSKGTPKKQAKEIAKQNLKKLFGDKLNIIGDKKPWQ